MTWYRAGTVTVTNGSPTVIGAGTDFVSNVVSGDAFRGPDGRTYEIARVVSATELTLGEVYVSGTAGGQAYAIQPTQDYVRDLANGAADLVRNFSIVRDGVGQGLFGDGSPAAPGVRFAADQDSGLRRVAANVLALVTGGVDIMTLGSFVGIGTGTPISKLHVNVSSVDPCYGTIGNNNGVARLGVSGSGDAQVLTFSGRALTFGNDALNGVQSEFARFDVGGNVIVGVTSNSDFGGAHRIAKRGSEGGTLLSVDNANAQRVYTTVFIGVEGGGYNTSLAAQWVGKGTTTNRSINAAGTGNFSGSDYAEYMRKALGCGTILKGDVCGVGADGKLTRTWADAIRYVVKSTDPSLVGGDTWASHLPPPPPAPGDRPAAPAAPGPMPQGEDDAAEQARAEWRATVDTYPGLLASYEAALGVWNDAVAAYEVALPAWEAELEKARACVDRIAFSGQVPVNVDADTLAACEAALADGVAVYLVAIARGAGIGVTAVREADMTLQQYMRRVGCVWAIRDGRPWVDVQHG